MSSLSRMIKRERHRKYKRIKKVFKARDMASRNLKKNSKAVIRVSSILGFYSLYDIDCFGLKYLAKDIYDRDGKMERLRPSKPPSRPVTAKK